MMGKAPGARTSLSSTHLEPPARDSGSVSIKVEDGARGRHFRQARLITLLNEHRDSFHFPKDESSEDDICSGESEGSEYADIKEALSDGNDSGLSALEEPESVTDSLQRHGLHHQGRSQDDLLYSEIRLCQADHDVSDEDFSNHEYDGDRDCEEERDYEGEDDDQGYDDEEELEGYPNHTELFASGQVCHRNRQSCLRPKLLGWVAWIKLLKTAKQEDWPMTRPYHSHKMNINVPQSQLPGFVLKGLDVWIERFERKLVDGAALYEYACFCVNMPQDKECQVCQIVDGTLNICEIQSEGLVLRQEHLDSFNSLMDEAPQTCLSLPLPHWEQCSTHTLNRYNGTAPGYRPGQGHN